MKTPLKIILLTIFLLVPSSIIIAQQPTTSQILGEENQEEELEDLDKKETEREEDFLNQLLLDIPILTDNPSHIITFVDPSEQKNGVSIEIDAKSFQEIESPYSLPALSIGKHELRFKFVDKYGSTQILEKEIVIIPRPPIINSPTLDTDSLLISGTGLSNSELVLILSSNRNILTKETEIDSDGNWEISIERTELKESVFTFTAYTRRYGYASNLAEPVTFEIGESQTIMINGYQKSDIYFKFKDITLENLSQIISNNIDLVILIAVTFTLGFILASLLISFFRNQNEGRSIKILEKKINDKGKDNKDITLKEKLSQKKDDQIERKEPIKKVEEKQEKIVTKIDFLKDFKMFDPDNEKGKEKDNIKVSVTSKD